MAEKVTCLECGGQFGALGAHLGQKHGMKKAAYLEKYGADTPFGPDWADYHKRKAEGTLPPPKEKPVVDEDDDLKDLTEAERRMYDSRFAVLWDQAERDEALASSIRDLAINDVLLARVQRKLLKISSQKDPDTVALKSYQAIAESIQEKILDNLKELNLTRKAKQALNKSPETTPSRMITNYKLVLASMTADEREKELEDEKDALRRLHENVSELFALIPAPGTVESEIDESLDPEEL